MPVYFYKAVSRDGEVVEEQKEAADEQSLIASLQLDGYIPVKIAPAGARPFHWLGFGRRDKSKLSPKEIGLFTGELATLLEAGLPLDRSLMVLMELSGENPRLFHLADQVMGKVKGGANLSDALESQSGVFSRFYLNMIRAGEAGGDIEAVLRRLSEYLERTKGLRDTVTTALIYPAVLLVMSLISLFVLLTFVVPQFTEMFETAGKELPLPTQIVIGVAEWLRSYWWALLLAVMLGMGYMRHQLSDLTRKYVWDQRFLKMPIAGELIRNIETAVFSRTLGTLLGNGVPLLKALSIVRETIGNRVLVEKVGFAEERLKNGGDMSSSLIESEQFPKMAMQMIKLGEETGRLEEMLQRVATAYDNEIKVSIQRMLALLEPVLIVGLGLLIGGIMASILMAVMSVNDLAF